MEDNMDMNFEDFFSSFDCGEYHDDTGEQTTEQEVTEETEEGGEEDILDSEGEETPESTETAEEESNQEADKDGAEGGEEPEKTEEKRSFDNLKVNGEIRSCTYEEAPAWIQKGMDYDRVKEQLENERRNSAGIRSELDQAKATVTLLEQAAADSNMTVEQMLDHMQIGILMSQGMTDKEAKAELRALKAERKVKAAEPKEPPTKEEPAQQAEEDRAQREVQEFMRDFPNVQLSDEDISAMKPYVQKGMSMSTAYAMMKNAKLEADAQQKAQEAAAREKNRKNKAKATSSQRDSGGQRTKDAMEDFFSAFEK